MNRLSIFKILIFSILVSPLLGQADYNKMAKIPLKTTWEKGQSYQYELVKGKINYYEGKEDSRNEARQTVMLTVKEVSSKGYFMEAVYNSPAYLLPDEIKQFKGIDKLVEKYREIKVRYAISPTGKFLGILNGHELQTMLLDLFDIIENSTVKNEMSATVLANMRCNRTSEVAITEGMFQELRLLHQFYGNEYAPDAYQEYNTELANMLEPQGNPIPAQASLKVSWLEDKYCLVEHTLAPNETIMKKLIFDYFKKMSQGATEVQNTEGVSLKVHDEGKYAFHQPTGWLVELYKTRTIDFEEEKTVEFVRMVMLEKGSF